MGQADAADWHALSAEAALARLESRPSGLDAGEAGARGAARSERAAGAGCRYIPLRRFFAQFNDS